jgi:hypothetical protein
MAKWIIVISCCFISYLGEASVSEKQIYNQISSFYQKNLPLEYSALLKGEIITSKLKEIPSQKGSLAVRFLFHKKWGGRFVVENSSTLYKNHVASLNNIVLLLKPFLDSANFKVFSQTYILLKGQKKHEVILRKRLEDSQNFSKVIFRNNGSVYKISIYDHQKLKISFIFSYKKVEKYLLLSKIQREDKLKKEQLIFFDYDLFPNLEEEDFLG